MRAVCLWMRVCGRKTSQEKSLVYREEWFERKKAEAKSGETGDGGLSTPRAEGKARGGSLNWRQRRERCSEGRSQKRGAVTGLRLERRGWHCHASPEMDHR